MDISQILVIAGWVFFVFGFLSLLANTFRESIRPEVVPGPVGPVTLLETAFSAAAFIVGAIILSARYVAPLV